MAESPKSERSETRFSTPVSELDDHRFQASSLPRVDISEHPTRSIARRGTMRSIANERPDLLQVNDALYQTGLVTGEDEQAVQDDHGSFHASSNVASLSRAASNDPTATGNNITTKSGHSDIVTRSRKSSESHRSTTPPNSVDAFAAPRRRDRAGTVISTCPSDPELGLRQTISSNVRSRRPTFSEIKTADANNDAASHKSESRHSSAEEDVCFPAPDVNIKEYSIDYEELEEFVAEQDTCTKTPILHALDIKRKDNSSVNEAPRVFNDLRPKKSFSEAPDLATEHAVPPQPDCGFPSDEKVDMEHNGADALPHSTALDGRATQLETLNRWTFFSSEMDNSVHAAELGGLLMPGENFKDLFELGPEAGVWWLDLFKPTEEEVTAVCKAFRIHPLTKEDICTQEAREKVELFRSYYFVCFRSFYQVDKTSEDFMEPISVYAIVFREGLLTFTFCQNPHAANVRKRIGRLRDYVSLGADWICYALIDDIVDNFGPVIRDVESETDSIEDEVFTARAEDSRRILRAIGDSRKKVMSLLRLLGGKADVIKGFAKRCNEQYSVAPRGDVGLYLSDIQDHVVTMMGNLGHFEKMLSRSHSNYLAQISVDNISQGNKINEVLGKVTFIATILIPLNLVCGLFGMNVPVPGKDSGSLNWFFGIFSFMALVIAIAIVLGRRLKYL